MLIVKAITIIHPQKCDVLLVIGPRNLLGGQKITAEIEKEAGVPILSKIPLLGRLFTNRSMVRDHKILLILVKPTIILQEEREAEALAAMSNFSIHNLAAP